MAPQGALVVIGAGPGIGLSTATLFAERGFKHVILLSRNKSRLADDAKAVKKAVSDVKVDVLELDLVADQSTVEKVLAHVSSAMKDAGTQLEAVLYNGARVGPSKVLEWKAEDLEKDLRMTTVSLYITLQWAIPLLISTGESSSANPAFLVTCGGLYREPFPFLFSLAAGKASQHNLIVSFHRQFEPKVHIAAVPISGVVSDDARVSTPKAIAEQFWKLYEQPKGTGGKASVEIEDPDYYDQVEEMRKGVEGQ